ncbi:MAG: CoA transferase, partial [Actinobacteria bacterium]|nr:CoA transferase [Actinomycetota bacterium]
AVTLAHRADVFVENFRAGALDRHGLGYEQVAAVNPGVVYCSISGFGRGAGADLAGYDFLVQAVGGLMSITGDAAGEPTKVGVALVDVLTAKDATIGVLAALAGRARTGRGQRVEVNLLSSLLGSLVNQASGYLATGRAPGRMGNGHPSIAPYETLRCADDQLAVCCGNDGQFARLTDVLGVPGLAVDERFATNAARVAHRPDLIRELEAVLVSDTAETWTARLVAVGIPAGRVATVADGIELARSLGLDPLVDVGPGVPPQIRHPIGYSDTPVTRYTAPPRLGEHDDEIRRWLATDDYAR